MKSAVSRHKPLNPALRPHFSKNALFLALAATFSALSAPAVRAEEVTYTPGAPVPLQNIFSSWTDVLLPAGTYGSPDGKSTSLSGNIVKLLNTPTDVDYVLGGLSYGFTVEAVTNNRVFIDSSQTDVVYGGYSEVYGSGTATVSNNSVSLSDSQASNVVGGYSYGISGNATSTGNSVSLSDSQADYVFGGESINTSGAATSTGNSVSLSDSSDVNGEVVGGRSISDSGSATASNNTVSLSDSSDVDGGVVGGESISDSGNATANDNNVSLSDDSAVGSEVVGGKSISDDGSATASGNRVVLNDNSSANNVTGGQSESTSDNATASNNNVSLNGDSMAGGVLGGESISDSGNATTTGNVVTLNDNSQVFEMTIGGYSESVDGSATSTDNHVTLSGDSVAISDVLGGQSRSDTGNATANDNTVSLSDDSQANGVVGGRSGSDTGDATASNNRISLSGNSQATGVYGGESISTSGTATASNNTVSLSDSSDVNGGVVGGYSESDDGDATASNNRVSLSGSSYANGNVYGGESRSDAGSTTASNNTVSLSDNSQVDAAVYGGYSESTSGNATALNNRVIIQGGTVTGKVVGGYSYSTSADATASNNNVIIQGGTVTGDVVGGESNSYTGSITANYNTVTLSGAPTITGNIYGSQAGGGASSLDIFTGNTLNVQNYSGSGSIGSVQNFQHYNFVLPANLSGPALAVGTLNVQDPNPTGHFSSVEKVSFMGGGHALGTNDSVTLIQASNPITGTLANDGQEISSQKGITLDYTLRIDQNSNNTITATVTGVKAHEQSKALSEGFISGLALANQGGDLAAGAGMTGAVNAAREQGSGSGAAVFGALSGGSLSYKTGSHVDMKSVTLITGASRGQTLSWGHLTLGGFFEYGNGSYDTFNAFTGGSAQGDGNTRYAGVGALGKLELPGTGQGNAYVEASLRGGRLHNHYKNQDIPNSNYKSASAYYGAHLGAGYVAKIDQHALDLYGKYFWTRLDGDAVILSSKDPVKFKMANSSRVRVGGRWNFSAAEAVTPYLGAAVEYEFEGKANATTYGYSMDAPSLHGVTRIAEAGLTIKPTQVRPLSVDVKIQAHQGAREGFTGTIHAKWTF